MNYIFDKYIIHNRKNMFSKDNFLSNNQSTKSINILDNVGNSKFNIIVENIANVFTIKNILQISLKSTDKLNFINLEFPSNGDAEEANIILSERISKLLNKNYQKEFNEKSGNKNWIEKGEELIVRDKYQYNIFERFTIDGNTTIDGELVISPSNYLINNNECVFAYTHKKLLELKRKRKLKAGYYYKLTDFRNYNKLWQNKKIQWVRYKFIIDNDSFFLCFDVYFIFWNCIDTEITQDNIFTDNKFKDFNFYFNLQTNLDEETLKTKRDIQIDQNKFNFIINLEKFIEGVMNIQFSLYQNEEIQINIDYNEEFGMNLNIQYKPKQQKQYFPIENCDEYWKLPCMEEQIEQINMDYYQYKDNYEIFNIYESIGYFFSIPVLYDNNIREGLILYAVSNNEFHTKIYSNLHSNDELYYDIEPTANFPYGKILMRNDLLNRIKTWYDWRYIRYNRWLNNNNEPIYLSPTWKIDFSNIDFSNGIYIEAIFKNVGLDVIDVIVYNIDDFKLAIEEYLDNLEWINNVLFISYNDYLINPLKVKIIENPNDENFIEKEFNFNIQEVFYFKTFNSGGEMIYMGKNSENNIFNKGCSIINNICFGDNVYDNTFLSNIDELNIDNGANNNIFKKIENVNIDLKFSNLRLDDIKSKKINNFNSNLDINLNNTYILNGILNIENLIPYGIFYLDFNENISRVKVNQIQKIKFISNPNKIINWVKSDWIKLNANIITINNGGWIEFENKDGILYLINWMNY